MLSYFYVLNPFTHATAMVNVEECASHNGQRVTIVSLPSHSHFSALMGIISTAGKIITAPTFTLQLFEPPRPSMKHLLLIFGFITAGGIVALITFMYLTLTSAPTPDPGASFGQSASGSGLAQTPPQANTHIGIPVRRTSEPPPHQLSLDARLPDLREAYSSEDVHDILFPVDILHKMLDSGILTLDQLVIHTKAKGFHPMLERRGHIKTGFRQVVKIDEIRDHQRMIREFHGSYYEHGDELIFDRFYYGLEIKPYLYEQLVKEFDLRIGQNYSRKLIQEARSRWDFNDGKFLFIHAEYDRNNQRNNDTNDKMILMGLEWEIH